MAETVYGDRWVRLQDRPLGEGGQAQTFLVRDRLGAPDDRFALKRLKNVKRLERFAREVEAVRSLQHPNVLTIVDASLETDGKGVKPFLVTEFCAAGSLADGDPERWAATPLATLEVFAQVCDGVGAAHRRPGGPVVHRDLKPENVLLRGPAGPPVVGDFGIAYVADGTLERLTEVHEAAGARNYIAPELEDGRAETVLPASDVYSLGKLLYWMLSGGEIFARERHRSDKYNLVKKFGRNEYEHVNRLLDRMIAADPEDRIADAYDAAGEVRAVAELCRRGARVLGAKLPQTCEFCKQGTYAEVPMGVTGYHNFFGANIVGGNRWRVLVCELCGHVQTFRADLAKMERTWWP